MTVLEIKNYCWSLLDDLNGDYFTAPEMLRYINQCTQETQKKLVLSGNNWYAKIDTSTSTVVNQRNYSLPTDFLKMNRLESVININTVSEQWYPITSITLNQKDQNFLESEPTGFYFLKSTLYLTPPPKTIRTLRMYYTYRVAQVALDADIPDVPEEFHEYIANLVVQRCFLKDGRSAELVERQIMQVEESLKAEAIERAQDHASTVVIVEEDYPGY